MPSSKKKTHERNVARLKQLQALKRRKAEFPYLFYEPHKGQRRFHRATEGNRIRLVRTSNRWGKTHGGMAEAIAHIVGYYFWKVPDLQPDEDTNGWLPHRRAISQKYWVRRADGTPMPHPTKGLFITGQKMFKGVGRTFMEKFWEFVPKRFQKSETIVIRYESAGVPKFINFPDGSSVIFGSEYQDDMEYESIDIHWVWADEPFRESIFNGVWRGLTDHLGSLWCTMTPLGHKAMWMRRWIKEDGCWVSPPGKMSDNPHLSEIAIKDFEAKGDFTESQKRARTMGEWEKAGGLVYPSFELETHVVEDRPIPKGWIIGQTVDPHHARPAAVVWWALDPIDYPNYVIHFFREWPNDVYVKMEGGCLSVEEYAILFRQVERGEEPVARFCDPRFGKAAYKTFGGDETVWVEEMMKFGLFYRADIRGIERIETGHTLVRSWLRHDKSFPLSPTNRPRILVHKCCENIIAAMEQYAHKDNSEAVEEDFKDFADAVRYTVLGLQDGIGFIEGGEASDMSAALGEFNKIG